MPRSLAPISVCILLAALASTGYATPVDYGTFIGRTVIFQDVTDGSVAHPTPLFEYPITPISGDSLWFAPGSFGASAGQGKTQTTAGTLSMLIAAMPGHDIDLITITEQGDYTMIGRKTAGTYVSVVGAAVLTVLNVNGQPINPLAVTVPLVYTPSNGDFNLRDDVNHGSWAGLATINVESILAGANIHGEATLLSFSLENILTAVSETGTSVLIKKKGVGNTGLTGISVTGPTVPEPLTCVSFLTLTGLLAWFRRPRAA